MKKGNATIWMCDNCGNEFSQWSGRCNICGEWNTLKEVKSSLLKVKSDRRTELSVEKISDIKVGATGRIDTKIGELNRALGGGIVPGSIVLVGGEPGIGKSTLLLQVADNIGKTFYLSAEESVNQIKMRADRLSVSNEEIFLVSDYDIDSVLLEVAKKDPKLLIVDSIQTIATGSIAGTPGSLVQVRECGIILQQFAKSSGIPIVLIGHVTKDGSLAGPRMLEHLVDTVLYLEGERFHDGRIIRGIKNRFGATDEVGIFSMTEKGMREVLNPSEVFLSERQAGAGSIITAVLEGTRPMLVEIQALAIPTSFGFPKRTTSGFDLNRLNLLAAVISKKTALNLSNYDIYVNVVGGMKVSEPSVDIAVCAAIMSSVKNRPLPGKLCLFGEVGLSGEIRKVVRQKEREKEATKLGYEIVTLPKNIDELGKLINI